MKPIIVAVSGPSGAGKSFLANKLKEFDFKEIVSVTTRSPREGEKHGVNYFYVSKDEFLIMDAKGELIEKTFVNGNYYGVPSSEPLRLAKEGCPIVVVAEPDGVNQIREYCKRNDWHSVEVFVNSPIDVLLERLEKRKQEELSKLDKSEKKYDERKEKIINASESRKEHLFEKEIKEWVEPAYSKNSIFKLIIDEFNQNNEKEIVNKVLSMVNKLKSEENLECKNEDIHQTKKRKIK